MTLREQARLALIGDGTMPWGDNVLEMNAATAGEQLPSPVETGAASGLPFVIVKLGPQTPGQVWGNQGDSLEVWPYSPDETLQDLDALCGLVVMRLDRQVLTDDDGAAYQSSYAGSPLQDTTVSQWDAYSRPLRFDTVALRWRVPSHPLAVAMMNWTAATWPGLVQTDPQTWLPTMTDPAIYWRVTDLPRVRDASEHKPWSDWYRATLVGHVLSPDDDAREAWVDRLARLLPRASIEYPAMNTWLSEHEVIRADPNADQHVDGQLTVEVLYGAATPDYETLTMPYDPTQPGHGAAPVTHIITHGGDVPTETPPVAIP